MKKKLKMIIHDIEWEIGNFFDFVREIPKYRKLFDNGLDAETIIYTISSLQDRCSNDTTKD